MELRDAGEEGDEPKRASCKASTLPAVLHTLPLTTDKEMLLAEDVENRNRGVLTPL